MTIERHLLSSICREGSEHADQAEKNGECCTHSGQGLATLVSKKMPARSGQRTLRFREDVTVTSRRNCAAFPWQRLSTMLARTVHSLRGAIRAEPGELRRSCPWR